jgi:DNA-binding XRE family transcriptional regulator
MKTTKKDEIASTIANLRKMNTPGTRLQPQAQTADGTTDKEIKQRVSREESGVKTSERAIVMNGIMRQLVTGEITQGNALKRLRIEVLGLKQEKYANLVAVSRKTLSDVENDKGNYSLEVLNKIFRPFGLKTALVPVSTATLVSLLTDSSTKK